MIILCFRERVRGQSPGSSPAVPFPVTVVAKQITQRAGELVPLLTI